MFLFGKFRVDPQSRAVTRDDCPIALNRRAFDVLVYLLENPGRAVTKEELLRNVWPDAHVDENNLTQSISVLRKALEEKPGTNGFIATLPGLGYQFIAPVGRALQPVTETPMGDATGLATGSFVLQQQTLTTTVVTEERRRGLSPGWLVGSLVVVAVLAGAYAWRHRAGATPLHKVVVSDFGNSTGDPTFDRTLRRALEIDLAQSPYLDVMSEAEGIHGLELMGRASDEPLTAAIAREVCVRTNREVVLTGNIASVGKEYLLTLDATDCRSAAKLAGAKAQAGTREEILRALDTVAEHVRSKLGESAASVSDFDVPIQEATTPSLDALKAYSMGQRMEALGKEAPEVLPFYQQAVALDPQFAMAWGALASNYYNASENSLGAQANQKAFALSRNLDARQKLTIEAHYYNGGISDTPRAIKAFQLWAATYPQDWVPWQNLCNDYNELGMRQEAIAAGEHALQLEPNRSNIYNVLIRAYKLAGRNADAERLGQEAVRRGLDSDAIHAFLLEAALNAHNQAALDREAAWSQVHAGWFFIYDRARTEASVGKMRQAKASFDRSREMAERDNLADTADSILTDQALIEYDAGMVPEARAIMALIKKGDPDDPDLARLHAELGDARYAERFLLTHPDNTTNTLLNALSLPKLRAVLALQQRKPLAAVAALEPSRSYGKYDSAVLTERGTAYLQAGKPELAASEFSALLASANGTDATLPLYNLAHLNLARAYAQAGKPAESREEYARFLTLWADADPEVPVLKQARMEAGNLKNNPSTH